MKKIALTTILVLLITPVLPASAEDLDSGNYTIEDFSVGNLGDQTVSANYASQLSSAEVLADDRFSSANYDLEIGVNNTWRANVPLVACFESTTELTSNCSDPDVADGMVQVCGDGGCYDRARFEIDSQLNPPDTLYSARITTDPAWNSWDYIDGTTFTIEAEINHNLTDYLSENVWEGTASSFNIFGLDPDTTYYLRLTALHGDFTESYVSPDATMTTGVPGITFDIDIDDAGGSTTETSAPYSVDLGTLILGQVNTANDRIWLDLGTNLPEGAGVTVRDVNGGLSSTTAAFTLSSADADLSATSGYGLRGSTTNQTYLGPIAFSVPYNQTGDNVGGLITDLFGQSLLSSPGPLYGGRSSVEVKARPSEATPQADDYLDTLVFTARGNI